MKHRRTSPDRRVSNSPDASPTTPPALQAARPLMLAVALLLWCPVARADLPTSRYVHPAGSDANPGTRELPLATIQHAIDAAAAGDTVLLMDGTYTGAGNRDLTFRGKNLRLASESDDPTAVILDCQGSEADPHYGFWFHDNEDTTSVIRGVTIRNAYVVEPAFAAVMCGDGLQWPGQPDYQQATVKIENAHVVDNEGNGIGAGRTSSSVFMSRCYVARNGGAGLAIMTWSSVQLSDCRFSENAGHGVRFGGDGPRPGHFSRCQFSNNDGAGLSQFSGIPEPRCYFSDCQADSNLQFGYSMNGASVVSLTNCTAYGNGDAGLRAFSGADMMSVAIGGGNFSDNEGDGLLIVNGASSYFAAANFISANNGGAGLNHRASLGSFVVDSAVIADNSGPGIALDVSNPNGCVNVPSILRTTIAYNDGAGLACQFNNLSCALTVDQTVIAHNLGAAMDLQGFANMPLALNCLDLYGNAGGDWVGAASPYLGTGNNISRIPLFCDAEGGNYHLQANSPLAAANSPCGTLGALDVGCPAPVLTSRELQAYDSVTGLCDSTMFNIQVTVEGVVYVAPGTYSEYGGGYLKDDTGGMNFWRFPVPTAIRRGDRIRITGPLWPDGDENLFIGNFTYTKLDSQLVPLPVVRTIAEIHGDYSLTGEYVKVSGRVANASAESFLLRDGTGEIEVRRNAYGGIDFSAVIDGALLEISSPVLKRGPTSYLMPAIQGDLIRSRQNFVGNDGDDANPGTRERPFRTIQRAVDAAFAGDVVLLLDGHYTGPGNVNVTWQDKSLAIRSESSDRTLCTIDGAGEPGFVYATTVAAARDSVKFSGITITGATTAISATSGFRQYGFLPVSVAVRDCALVDGEAGIHLQEAEMILEQSTVRGQQAVGIYHYASFLKSTIRNCVIRGNGSGVVQETSGIAALIDSTSIVANGLGVRIVHDSGSVSFSDCRVDSSTGGDGLHVSPIQAQGLTLNRCRFDGNARSGVRFFAPLSGLLSAVDCESVGNGLHGFEIGGAGANLSLDRVLIIDNDAWGIGHYVWPPQEPEPDGQEQAAPHRLAWRVLNSDVRRNAGGGVDADHVPDLTLSSVSILDNGGPGMRFRGLSSGRTLTLTDFTIAGNRGDGMLLAHCGGTGTRLAIAGNDSLGINLGEDAALNLACTDIYGNRSGDWIGALAPQLGVDGNLNVDPLFCNAAAGDYTLQENSPLAAENNPGCGTIGRYEAACPAQPWAPFEPRVRDVPDDQGGFLSVAWLRHGADAPSATVPITHYDVQRHHAEWQTITTLAAAAADSYAVTIATTDVQTIGQPLPWSKYRLVARTATPSIFFESAVDSAYSIDNLPPPKPDAQLVDGLDYRYIVWTNPDISDLATACVFRGESAGFTPGDPLSCPPGGVFTETHLAWYFYRVQFADIHGNLSEFSDELHGQWPTGVPGALPTALRLHPCRPNPFNPRTTITYDLPEAGGVRLAVFDLAGRLVRMLVDESRSQGSYEVVWDGRDDTGREVGSGTYLARLEFGGKMEVVRMGLVR